MRNMKLSAKLVGGFGSIFFLLLCVTAVMFHALNKTTAAFEIFMEEDFSIASHALKVETLLQQCRTAEKEYLRDPDSKYLRRHAAALTALQNSTRLIVDLSGRAAHPGMQRKSQAILPLSDRYQQRFSEIVKMREQAGASLDGADDAAGQLELAVQELSNIANKGAAEKVYAAKAAVANDGATAMALVFFALLATIGSAAFIIASVLNQLGEDPRTIAGIANRMAAGDLGLGFYANTREVKGVLLAMKKMVDYLKATADLAGEIARGNLAVKVTKLSDRDMLGNALEIMVGKLRGMVGEITLSADHVASGAGQMSATSQAVSRGATEQASALEEIASSMNEIAAQTSRNSESATKASRLAGETKLLALRGDERMGGLVCSIQQISESSRSISQIIKVIDEIAFQTNLLALNAAVEAARAGRHGAGFAVVAQEVKNLAARSASAAKETTELIQGSLAKVSDGTDMADATSAALKEIVEAASQMTDLAAEIAGACTEQAQGVAEIMAGLGQVEQVTQQNTAHAEESASSAQELAGQATALQGLVSAFKLQEVPAAPGRKGRPMPVAGRTEAVQPALDASEDSRTHT